MCVQTMRQRGAPSARAAGRSRVRRAKHLTAQRATVVQFTMAMAVINTLWFVTKVSVVAPHE
jgi:hypothetical protein